MSDNQDALLALADRIQEADNQPIAIDPAAAAELRRLHALVEEDSILLRRQRDEIASLKALNAELVAALKDLLFWGADDVYQRSKIACERARAAIDAARSKE